MTDAEVKTPKKKPRQWNRRGVPVSTVAAPREKPFGKDNALIKTARTKKPLTVIN
jgi:hypothetical protein